MMELMKMSSGCNKEKKFGKRVSGRQSEGKHD